MGRGDPDVNGRLEKIKQASALCALLANENRLMILCCLSKRPMNVTQLGGSIGRISQSALSQHLTLLREKGIISCTQCGRSMVYEVVDEKAIRIFGALHEVFQCGEPEDVQPA